MIIDFTGSAAAVVPISEEQEFDWDAYNEWKVYRNARVDSDTFIRSEAITIITAALLDDHFRGVLKKACCCQIRPEVVKIIDDLEVLSNPVEAMAGSYVIDTAAARIVDLDIQEQSRRKVERD